uniref:Uncharacterized protein n=1 Tax=Nothobranchius furzeri TaxID=105023 RepID=A0A8C6VWX5_NOTFU
MTTGVIRNLLIQGLTPTFFPILYQPSPPKEDGEVQLKEKPEGREDEEEEEEDEEEEESEFQEEEEESFDQFRLNPAHSDLNVTNQLLRFADLISRDIQRYFGHCSDDREACDTASPTTGGRRRYYDDLLRIAGAGSPEERVCREDPDELGITVAKGNSSLGPLAELFNHKGLRQSRVQPMSKRHLPLSFWTEPVPHFSLDSFGHSPDPDFSDLLAYWDPNPEFMGSDSNCRGEEGAETET